MIILVIKAWILATRVSDHHINHYILYIDHWSHAWFTMLLHVDHMLDWLCYCTLIIDQCWICFGLETADFPARPIFSSLKRSLAIKAAILMTHWCSLMPSCMHHAAVCLNLLGAWSRNHPFVFIQLSLLFNLFPNFKNYETQMPQELLVLDIFNNKKGDEKNTTTTLHNVILFK